MHTEQLTLSVGDVMTSDPILIRIDMRPAAAAQLMDFYNVSGLPVVDFDGVVVGVISQTDLLHARAMGALWRDWDHLAVVDLMTSPPATIGSGRSLTEAAETMDRLGIHRLVVTDRTGETPVGVVTASDIVRSMADWGGR